MPRFGVLTYGTLWQRFTERARKVVFYAQEEAQRSGDGYVSTEHLLLGLLREPGSTAMLALEAVGVDAGEIREEVERQLPKPEPRAGSDMTLTPRAKRVIDLAYDEARNLNHNYIGSEHLLLGLVREEDGLAGRVLAKLGAHLEPLRRVIMELAPGGSTEGAVKPEGGAVRRLLERFGMAGGLGWGKKDLAVPENNLMWERCTGRARAIIDSAREDAGARGAHAIGAEHLVLALLDDPECRGFRVVAGLGGDLERARRAAEALAQGSPEGEAPEPLPFSSSGQAAVTTAHVASAAMGNPFLGTEHLALALFGGAFGEALDPDVYEPVGLRRAVALAQAEE